MKLLNELLALKEARLALVLATVVDKQGDGPMPVAGQLLVDEKGVKVGTVGGGALEARVIQTAKALLDERQHKLMTYDMSGGPVEYGIEAVPMICGGRVTIFYEYIAPEPPLMIFGSGNVGGALLAKMQGTSFDLAVCDTVPPAELGNARHFEVLPLALAHLTEESYVVISTGSHDVDYDILKTIVSTGIVPRYLGMLASRKKTGSILKRLEAETGKQIDGLYSPIGLDIGGESPDEIAIAIAAQLIAKRNGKTIVKDLHV